jgi:hypothetical protein
MLQGTVTVPDNVMEGKFQTSGITGGTGNTVNGLLVYQGQLAMSAGNDYTYSQPVSHLTRPKNLSTTGRVSNFSRVYGDQGYEAARFTAGYMCHIPPEHQNALGGPALTGWVASSIVSATSDGPAAFSFDPNALKAGIDVAAKTKLFYHIPNSLQASVYGQSQQLWNWTSMVGGCAIPNGTRTALFIGSHGSGVFQYGVGGVNGRTNGSPSVPIYDPSDSSTGEHAWPYRYQIWAYDVDELSKVTPAGLKPHDVKPYSVWSFTLPFEDSNGRHDTGGVAYNPKTKQLYFVQQKAGPYGEAIIHVLRVNPAVSASITY